MKYKAFFIIFKCLSLKQIKQLFLGGESPALTICLMHNNELIRIKIFVFI